MNHSCDAEILQGLEVEEPCNCRIRGLMSHYMQDCPNGCKGSGYITRPPTAEEVRELIDYVLGNAIYEYERLWKRMINSTYKVEFTLKSGAILRMKGVK